MSDRRALLALPVALLTAVAALALGGCGGDDDHPSAAGSTAPGVTSAPSVDPSGPADPGEPSNTQLQQPKASETIAPEASLTAVPGASELPAQGFRTVQGFPVPPGVKVKDPGPLDDTWQFDIHSDDLDGVIAFYKRVLPQMGFRLRLGVSYTLGDEQVYWDLVFDGRISGTMVRDPDNGVVFVVVNPPGQPAIAGEK
ncbi:hypothetical protein ACVW00_000763 [Marmoricola sp. URHA0025 HA25]